MDCEKPKRAVRETDLNCFDENHEVEDHGNCAAGGRHEGLDEDEGEDVRRPERADPNLETFHDVSQSDRINGQS